MRVLLTGARGQLGAAVVAAAPPDAIVESAGRDRLDICDPVQIESVVSEIQPDILINCAAYTNVDGAEDDESEAFRINCDATEALARAARRGHARMIHISTDFVFDGQSTTPYAVDADVCPLNAYGRSKAEGERRVADILGDRASVVRTAWLYSHRPGNFLTRMLDLMAERQTLTVVQDQVGTPTSVNSLATAIWAIASDESVSGVQHWTDAGVASWYDFAASIAMLARRMGLISQDVQVLPVPSSAYPTRARRPSFSVLDKSATWSALSLQSRHWLAELQIMLRGLSSSE